MDCAESVAFAQQEAACRERPDPERPDREQPDPEQQVGREPPPAAGADSDFCEQQQLPDFLDSAEQPQPPAPSPAVGNCPSGTSAVNSSSRI
ncbi:MAG: hypothetical protein RIK87_04805 [Fuerstiella sp.]